MIIVLFFAAVLIGYFVVAIGLWGAALIARSATRTGSSRNSDIVFGLILLAPGTFLYYLFHGPSIDNPWHKAQYMRACRKRVELDIPPKPSHAASIELLSTWGVGTSSTDTHVTDLTMNPFIYLTGANGFRFVEYRGRRYSGTGSNFRNEPYDTPTSEYVVSIGRSRNSGAVQFHLTVIERASNRRVGSITGFINNGESCPYYGDVKDALSRMIQPRPWTPEPDPIPVQRVEASVAAPRREVDERIETAADTSGPASECPTLLYAARLKDSDMLEFRRGRVSRQVPLRDERGQRLYVIDLLCRAGEAFVLTRGNPMQDAAGYHLSRYSSDGTLISRLQLHAEGRDTLDPPTALYSTTFLARNMAIDANDLSFELVQVWGQTEGETYRGHATIQWYAVSLPQ